MIFAADDRVFVDESKSRGYIVAATAASPATIRESEKALRMLLKPGQRRLHFKSERDSRRREILSGMCKLDVRVAMWVAKGLPNKDARDACLASIVAECCASGASTLILERDESLMGADRKVISAALRLNQNHSVCYSHATPHEQPLLWISDAIAWCYAKGGDWVRRIEPLLDQQVFRL